MAIFALFEAFVYTPSILLPIPLKCLPPPHTLIITPLPPLIRDRRVVELVLKVEAVPELVKSIPEFV